MTPSDVQATLAAFRRLWPRARWGDGEFDVFNERARKIEISPEQADAALRNVKATTDKYPSVASILAALTHAENKPRVGPASELPAPESRVGEMRRRLAVRGIRVEPDTRAAIVIVYWKDACARSMRMRADVPENYATDYTADAIEAGGMGQDEAAQWWEWILFEVKDVALDPDLAEHAAANGRMSPTRAVELLGATWNVRPRMVGRAKRLKELMAAIEQTRKPVPA